MKLSLAFTTFNSANYIKQQIDKNYFEMSCGLVDEIIIQDDFSNDYNVLKPLETEKIKIFQIQPDQE